MRSTQVKLPRLAYVAIVTLLAVTLAGASTIQRGKTGWRVEALIRTSRDFDGARVVAQGPIFTATELARANLMATGRAPTASQVQELRSRLQVSRSPGLHGIGGRTRLTLSTPSNPETGRRIVNQLAQIAVHRWNTSLAMRDRQHQRDWLYARLSSAQQQEAASQSALDHFLTSWMNDNHQMSVRQTALQTDEPAEMVNPKWEAYARKKDRLELRLEELLETHRREHPIVQRLHGEIERVESELAETQTTLPGTASAATSGLADVGARPLKRPPSSPTWTIAAEHRRRIDQQTQQSTYAKLRSELEAARANRIRLGEELFSQPKEVVRRAAWIDRPAEIQDRRSPNGSRLYLVLLSAVLAAVTMVGGRISLDGLASEDLPQSPQWRWGNLIHGTLLLLCESITALVAIAAVTAISTGDTAWLRAVADHLH